MILSEKEKIQIPLRNGYPARSLSWQADDLVDLAAGGDRYHLDGTVTSSSFYFAYGFDRAVMSPDGNFAVVYEVLGTKGLIMRGAEELREINRSYYHAQTYEYPITLFCLRDGRAVIAHCPEEYNKIEIEEIESGRRLTERDGEATDFFHSRLQTSPNGEHLLSAGWMWHPIDACQLFSISEVLRNPNLLNQPQTVPPEFPEELVDVHAAAFQDNEFILLVGDDGGAAGKAKPCLARYHIKSSLLDFKIELQETPGTIMPINRECFVGFHGHPKLFEISSGKVVHRWPELNSGVQNSSVLYHLDPIPPIALDPVQKRFAVADNSRITVIQLG